jgi:hypothetical protein
MPFFERDGLTFHYPDDGGSSGRLFAFLILRAMQAERGVRAIPALLAGPPQGLTAWSRAVPGGLRLAAYFPNATHVRALL